MEVGGWAGIGVGLPEEAGRWCWLPKQENLGEQGFSRFPSD